MSLATRATLLERLRDADDPLAWDEFFQRYWRSIYLAARRQSCSADTAEDIVQQVMLTVFEKRQVFRYDPTRGRFRDWLSALVRNQVAQRRRRLADKVRGCGGDRENWKEPPDPALPPDEAWEAAFEDSLLLVMLDVVRREVNPRTFQAFELFVLDELPGKEVARVTGLTANAVYQAKRTVCQRLAELAAGYRREGQLDRRLREVTALLPPPARERSLSRHTTQSMQSR